jgi:hypothetical protein
MAGMQVGLVGVRRDGSDATTEAQPTNVDRKEKKRKLARTPGSDVVPT